MAEKPSERGWVEKLINFFRGFRSSRPGPEEADYSRWNQTEADYQEEQAQWLESVRRRRAKREAQEKADGNRESD
jgi:Zn-finger nucleic acid-binding protein